ncbi:hypothetical protein RYX36_009347 [Vicia faba]
MKEVKGWSVRSLNGETVMDMRLVRQKQLLAIHFSTDGASNAKTATSWTNDARSINVSWHCSKEKDGRHGRIVGPKPVL